MRTIRVPVVTSPLDRLPVGSEARGQMLAGLCADYWDKIEQRGFRPAIEMLNRVLDEDPLPWECYDPTKAGKAVGLVTEIIGVSVEVFLARIEMVDQDLADRWRKHLFPNRKTKTSTKTKVVQDAIAKNPEATQQEIAGLFEERTGESITQPRVSQIINESSSLQHSLITPDAGGETAKQEAQRRGVSKATVDRERKLKTEYAEVWNRLEAGDIGSVHEACVVAGIIKPTTKIRTDDAAAAAKTLLKHYTADELIAAIKNA